MRVRLLVSPQQKKYIPEVIDKCTRIWSNKNGYLKHSLLTQWKRKVFEYIEESIAKL